jgi:hypothetical protein
MVGISIDLPGNIIGIQDEDEHNNLMIYGDSGVGKTVLAGSDDDVLFVAPEDNGTLSAKRFGSDAMKWKIREGADGWEDTLAAYKWLRSLETIPFNWVVLDSLTELQDMCMAKVIREDLEVHPGRDPDSPLIGDWVPYYNKFAKMVKAFNALEVNMLYTALAQEEEDDDGNKMKLPMLQGKGTQYAKKVASWMTSFGHISVRSKTEGEGENKRRIDYRVVQWKASKSVMAKDRTRVLEPMTIIGEGKLDGLKGIRELLEAGPQQPAPGRVVPKREESPNLVRSSTNESDESVAEDGDMVMVGEDD